MNTLGKVNDANVCSGAAEPELCIEFKSQGAEEFTSVLVIIQMNKMICLMTKHNNDCF